MTKYAQGTTVPVDRSKAEIENLLTKYGASSFMLAWGPNGAVVMFEAHERRIKFELPLPKPDEFRNLSAYDQEVRRRWRCLALVIKAKLEAVNSEIVSFEDEFLANTIRPGSTETIGQWIAPQIAAAYERGIRMPPMLGDGT